MTTIATFNINSINARLPNLLEWLRAANPDVVCLQELKCVSEAVPRLALAEAGYNVAVVGQKTYNGVAVLAKSPIEVVREQLPGDPDDLQARYLEVIVDGLRVASIYLPNGNPIGSERFPYKLAWLERLRAHAASLLEDDLPVVLAGDYNVIPEPRDCYNPTAWVDDALFARETRQAFRALLHLGLYDAFRVRHPDAEKAYTFWDYQQLALQLNHGLRIDHFLLSAEALDRLRDSRIDKEPRRQQRASDHTPILVELG